MTMAHQQQLYLKAFNLKKNAKYLNVMPNCFIMFQDISETNSDKTRVP